MYALIENGAVVEYPLSINAWRLAHPNISLPVEASESQLNDVGIFNVIQSDPPAFNPITHKAVEATPVFHEKWVQAWDIVERTEYEIRQLLKENRTKAVANIKVTTAAGNTFDGDEVSQTRMARAIIGLQATGTPSLTWVLADNTVIQATAAELTEAMALAGEAQAAIWVI